MCYICKEKNKDKHAKDKKYRKLRDLFIIQRNIEVLCIVYVI